MSNNTQTTTTRSRFGGASLVETFGVGRVCADAACATVLSRYNETQVCGPHTEIPRRR